MLSTILTLLHMWIERFQLLTHLYHALILKLHFRNGSLQDIQVRMSWQRPENCQACNIWKPKDSKHNRYGRACFFQWLLSDGQQLLAAFAWWVHHSGETVVSVRVALNTLVSKIISEIEKMSFFAWILYSYFSVSQSSNTHKPSWTRQ